MVRVAADFHIERRLGILDDFQGSLRLKSIQENVSKDDRRFMHVENTVFLFLSIFARES